MRWVCFALRRALALKFASGWALRLWTPTPKMNNAAWAKLVPALGRAAMPPRLASQQRANVWHDNETFLNQPAVYKKHGMTSVKFPPNSGDLNPIETVWAAIWPCRRWRICRLGVSSALANTSAAPH